MQTRSHKLRFGNLNRRYFILAATAFGASLAFSSCAAPQPPTASSASSSSSPVSPVATQSIKVGVSPVPAGEIMEFVQKNLAPAAGLEIEIVTFNDPVQNNTALKDGAIDANYFQHIPFMEDYGKRKGLEMYAFTPQIHLNPVGLFSQKHKSIADIPQNALVIPVFNCSINSCETIG